ncbi:hypothetical protein DAI22_12g196600 [Oryza sativa Japonica Group]|nr:hypothetical protein DAI22_12g196600 [Oryza sativa Japonica Group]
MKGLQRRVLWVGMIGLRGNGNSSVTNSVDGCQEYFFGCTFVLCPSGRFSRTPLIVVATLDCILHHPRELKMTIKNS